MDKEKAVYEVDSLQVQVDKALGQCSRVQKEKEAAQNELQKIKDKQDKTQVSFCDLCHLAHICEAHFTMPN